MRIQSINSVFMNQNLTRAKSPSFKGLVSPIESYTEDGTYYSWGQDADVGTMTFRESFTYYKFTDDSPEEILSLKNKYEYDEVFEPKDSASTDLTTTRKVGKVYVIEVPISLKKYNDYINDMLLSKNENEVADALKSAGLRNLLRHNYEKLDLKYASEYLN